MRQWFYLVAAIALAIGASLMIPGVNEMRSDHGLTANPVLENVPPELAIATTALGGFRGIVVDVLWIRAMDLQQSDEYFELVQLYDWIGKLEPRSVPVWVYSAWNMAYNISVEMPSAPERWRWIQLGLAQLRDHGIPYNQRAADLYKEMAWIYQHKIGGTVDDFHWHYKIQLAADIEDVFGRGPVTDLRPYLEAPQTLDELKAAAVDPDPVLTALKAAGYKPLDQPVAVLRDLDQEESPAKEVLGRPEHAAARDQVVMFLRAHAIRNVLKLDLRHMQRLQEEVGALDWRLPQAFTLYYIQKAIDYATDSDFAINYDRMRYEAIRRLYKKGSLFFSRATDKDRAVYLTVGNWRFFEKANEAFVEAIDKQEDNLKKSLQSAHAAFLEDAIVLMYMCSQVRTSARLYADLRKRYPNERYEVPYGKFVMSQVIPDAKMGNTAGVKLSVDGVLLNGYRWLAAGDDDRARGFFTLSKAMWNEYMKDMGPGQKERLSLPPYQTMNRQMRERALNGNVLPRVLVERLKKRLGVTETEQPKDEAAPGP